MDAQTLQAAQSYGFFALLVFMVVVLYGYWFYMRGQQKRGECDYEKYAKLALNDSLQDDLVEGKGSNSNLGAGGAECGAARGETAAK